MHECTSGTSILLGSQTTIPKVSLLFRMRSHPPVFNFVFHFFFFTSKKNSERNLKIQDRVEISQRGFHAWLRWDSWHVDNSQKPIKTALAYDRNALLVVNLAQIFYIFLFLGR